MTKNQEETIERLNKFKKIEVKIENRTGVIIEEFRTLQNDLEIVLDMIKEKDKEIEKKDNAVKRIINRLNDDYKRITETKAKKQEKYLDDYTRCRLNAYRTKTKEIKEYIEEQYFERKATNDG